MTETEALAAIRALCEEVSDGVPMAVPVAVQVRMILNLVRPASDVVLTVEEATLAAAALTGYAPQLGPDVGVSRRMRVLAARLEAGR